MKNILKDSNIIGVVSNYKSNLVLLGKIKDLKIKNINKALKIVGLDESFLDKSKDDLTISELWKIDLLTKLDKDIIIIGNLCDSLNSKDLEYMKKLFNKLAVTYHKKIVLIDKNITSFFGVCEKILVIKDKNIIYKTNDFFDNKLYDYVNMPKIIEFIKYVNKDIKRIDNTLDIYELIKDIYRSVS